MTNEELSTAIVYTIKKISIAHSISDWDTHATLSSHLKYLLEVQRIKAARDCAPLKGAGENFTDGEVLIALRNFLDFGEQGFREKWQQEYFSGDGWAARVLRYHYDQLTKETK